MDTFRAANEIATIKACCTRALADLGDPPELEVDNTNKREHLHARAHLALTVAADRIEQARIAVERLEQMEVV
jgi:hypothetical protein